MIHRTYIQLTIVFWALSISYVLPTKSYAEASWLSAFQSMAKEGPSLPGWLGVQFNRVTDDIADKTGREDRKGAYILAVAPNGPAEVSKLQSHDIILKVATDEIDEHKELAETVRDIPSGTVVPFTVWRDQQLLTVQVLIGGQAWSKSLQTGDVEVAQGYAYYNGSGVSKNYKTAVEWLKKAAALNNPHAWGLLGHMYRKGYGVSKDYEEAKRLFSLAAEQGDVDALVNIAVMYEKGEGYPKSEEQAFAWYKKAAELGEERSMATVGLKRLGTDNIAEDMEEAYFWLSLALRHSSEELQRKIRRARSKTGYQFWPDAKLEALNEKVEQWEPKASALKAGGRSW